MNLADPSKIDGPFGFSRASSGAYERWREHKLLHHITTIDELLIEVGDLRNLSRGELTAIQLRCSRANTVVYHCRRTYPDMKAAIRDFARQLGVVDLDRHLCGEQDGIAIIQVENHGPAQDYIPYSNRALNWHTDGYYNELHAPVRSVIMHCVEAAIEGGGNGLLDHEWMYMRIRDQSPELARALMQPHTMTIPANIRNGQMLRKAISGPVFSVDSCDGTLHMRYTPRKRSISWALDRESVAARALISHILEHPDTPSLYVRLQQGQGIVCNNVLHGRDAFQDGDKATNRRRLLRARSYTRISIR